jgi:hypothetical protein
MGLIKFHNNWLRFTRAVAWWSVTCSCDVTTQSDRLSQPLCSTTHARLTRIKTAWHSDHVRSVCWNYFSKISCKLFNLRTRFKRKIDKFYNVSGCKKISFVQCTCNWFCCVNAGRDVETLIPVGRTGMLTHSGIRYNKECNSVHWDLLPLSGISDFEVTKRNIIQLEWN